VPLAASAQQMPSLPQPQPQQPPELAASLDIAATIADVLMPHGAVRRQPPRCVSVVGVVDHNDLTAATSPLHLHAFISGAAATCALRMCSVQTMRRCLTEMGISLYDVLFHPGDPRSDGMYGPFNHQGKAHNHGGRQIDQSGLVEKFYRPSAERPLLAIAKQGPELLYIGNIFGSSDVWRHSLSANEITMIERLRVACGSVDTLLSFELANGFSIHSATTAVAHSAQAWFHGCVHLRWAYHCAAGCSAIHDFDEKRYRQYNAKGEVIDCGSVTLTSSQRDSHGGAKAALLDIAGPLGLLAQAYLLLLPEHLRPPALPEVGFTPWWPGLFYTYLSLNIYWDTTTAPTLPTRWYDRRAGKWMQQQRQHGGLYLHRDQNNDGWGAVLTFGVEWKGYEQGYVTLALELPCPGWSLVIGNYRSLLHYVRSGVGLRMSLVLANHRSLTCGVDEVGREVWAPVD
jgi:hypothetical protein